MRLSGALLAAAGAAVLGGARGAENDERQVTVLGGARGAEGDERPSAATFVLTQEGMNNLPALFGDAIVRAAVEAANLELSEKMHGITRDLIHKTFPDCGGGDSLCKINNFLFDFEIGGISGAIGPHGDEYIGLTNYFPPSVEFSLERCHDGPLKCLESGKLFTAKMVAQVDVGAKLSARGSAVFEDGFLDIICCAGFETCGHLFGVPIPCPWVGLCSCEPGGHNCGCNQVCDSPMKVTAKNTRFELEVGIFHTATGFSATLLDTFPFPTLGDDLEIERGCLDTMIDHVTHMHMSHFGPIGLMTNIFEWVLQTFFGAPHWGDELSGLWHYLADAFDDAVKMYINDFLANQVPVEGQGTCGEECNLPKGVTINYGVKNMTVHEVSEGNYLEAVLSATVCADKSLLPGGGSAAGQVCFDSWSKEHADTTPPLKSVQPFSSTAQPGSRMLTGIRASSSLIDGISWAMGEAGLFLTSSDIQALDAKLAFNVSWAEHDHPPRMGVTETNSISFEWTKGFVRVICKSIGVDMMDFRWTDMIGNGSVVGSHGGCKPGVDMCECGTTDESLVCGEHNQVCEGYTSEEKCAAASNPVGRCVWKQDGTTGQSVCMRNTCLSPKVTDFDVSKSKLQLVEPHLPLPDEFVDELMETSLQKGKVKLNALLDDNSFCIPPGVNQYLGSSDPLTSVFNQHVESDATLGYLQIASYCGPGFASCLEQTTASDTSASDDTPSVAASGPAAHEDLQPASQLLGEAASSEVRDSTSTYTVDGHEYRYGASIITIGSECKNPCTTAPRGQNRSEAHPGQCVATYFKDEECKNSVKRSCRRGMYIEESYQTDNCTGPLTANATELPANVCTLSNLSIAIETLPVGMMAVCPTLVPAPAPPGHAWEIVADVCIAVAVVAALGVLAVRCCSAARLQQCCDSTAAAVGTSLPAAAACCTRAGQLISVVGTAVSAFCSGTRQLFSDGCAAISTNLPVVGAFCTRAGQAIGVACAPCVKLFRSAQAWCADRSIRAWCAEAARWVWPRMKRCAAATLEFCKWVTTWRPRPIASLDTFDCVELAVNCCAALGFGGHGLLWVYDDPFRAFNENVFQEIGVEGSLNSSASDLINSQVQQEFTQWSHWGKVVQAVGCGLIVLANLAGMIDQLRPTFRATMHTAALVLVAVGQVSIMLIPPFIYDLSVSVNENGTDPDSMLQDSEFRAEADNVLSFALDGVALTFISSLFMFLLHGLAPGVFLGSCLFGAYLIFQRSKAEPAKPARSALDLVSSGRVSMIHERLLPQPQGSISSFRSSFTAGVTTGSVRSWHVTKSTESQNDDVKMPTQLLQQQQPRVRILNWLVCLGAPCGGCLPAIIVYQSLGADPSWAGCFVFCWVLPTMLMYPLIRVLKGNDGWGERALAVTAFTYFLLYTTATLIILIGMKEKAVEGGFTEISIGFPLTTFISSVLGAMALTNCYLRRALLMDATRLHMAKDLLDANANAGPEPQPQPEPEAPSVVAPAPVPTSTVRNPDDGASRPASPTRADRTLGLTDRIQGGTIDLSGQPQPAPEPEPETDAPAEAGIPDVILFDGHTRSRQKGRLLITQTQLDFSPASGGGRLVSFPLESIEKVVGDRAAGLFKIEAQVAMPGQEQPVDIAFEFDGREREFNELLQALIGTTPDPIAIGRAQRACEWAERTCPGPTARLKACWEPVHNWLEEGDEREDPRSYGRRLPYRRVMLAIGTGLTCWVIWRNFDENNGYADSNSVAKFKEILEEYDAGLQWPEDNATVLDDAIDTYGKATKVEFLIETCALLLLICACWCDWAVRDKVGLRFSRFFGFSGLVVMFFASLVTAAPNYMQISHLNTLCPCCAPKFNFLFNMLLQDMAGIFLSGLFAMKLLPVLLVVTPSIVRACTLIIYDDMITERKRNSQLSTAGINSQAERQLHAEAMRSYADPSFSRANVHSVFSMCSMLTPIFTSIPMMVLVQLLRRPQYDRHTTLGMGNATFMLVCVSVFYFAPMLLGWVQAKTTKSVTRRYFLWLLLYIAPLLLLGVREIYALDFQEQAKTALEENWWTWLLEIICEVLVANVILSDVMYSNLYVERPSVVPKGAQKKPSWRELPVLQLLLLVVVPFLLFLGGLIYTLYLLRYFEVSPRVHFQSFATNGHRDAQGRCLFDDT